MGSYLSTRWNGVRTRQETGGLFYLDSTALRRMGALTAGAHAWQQWTNGWGEVVGSIRTVTNANCDAVTLIYSIRRQGGTWQPMQEDIGLEATPCRYGGERFWLTCPRCQSRRRVLYGMEGRFQCRACHELAYTSTRLDAMERSAQRIGRLHRRLRAYPHDLFDIPPRPAGMRRATYDRICADLMEAQVRYGECLYAGYARLLERDGSP